MAQNQNPRGRRRKAESAPPPDEPKRRGRKPGRPGKADTSTEKREARPPRLEFEPLTVTSHRAFGTAKVQNAIFARFNANPDLAKLLLVNPVQAMKAAGVTLSTRLQRHVMHTLQYSPSLDAERKALEEHLHSQIGRKPRPNDPEWVAEFLFGQLGLKPLDTRDHAPAYKTPFDADMRRVYEKLRPKRRTSAAQKSEMAHQAAPPSQTPDDPTEGASRLTLKMPRAAVTHLDLDAPLPELRYARKAPKAVDLETLYFYKDSHPLVRDLLRLGLIQRRQFPIQSADAFRKIQRGERPNPFTRWISDVRFPMVEDDDEPDR
ncbi:MAG: hypothetical protein IT323_15430 [Anaerolineae bacterium]|nr:hypothetical protein [Anaerolineae bacterium]